MSRKSLLEIKNQLEKDMLLSKHQLSTQPNLKETVSTFQVKRGKKYRFFVEILLSEAELELLASEYQSPLPEDLVNEWLDLRGKVLLSGLEDSGGLGAEINDVLALGFAVKAALNKKQLHPNDSYWHVARYSIPVIEEMKVREVPCDWESQDNEDWMDPEECPDCEFE